MFVVGSMDFEPELDNLKSLIEEIKKFREKAKELNKKAIEALQLTESKDSPGRIYSPLDSLVDNVQHATGEAICKIADKVVKKWMKILVPNIDATTNELLKDKTVYYDEHYLYGELVRRERPMSSDDLADGFSPHWLFEISVRKYVSNAKQVSEEHILRCAREILPYRSRNAPNLDVKDILFGSVIRGRYFGYSFDRQDRISATNKIARVVLQDENIITVEDSVRLFSEKSFKNGRLDLKFSSEEDARKVAEVLVNGFPK